MESKLNFQIEAGQKFYAGAAMLLNQNVLIMLRKRNKTEITCPGGTYNGGDKKNWTQRGQLNEFYDNTSRQDILRKFKQILSGMTIAKLPKSFVNTCAEMLTEKFADCPIKTHAAIEIIEESGLIPVSLEPLHSQKRGIMQFFFLCKSFYSLKNGQIIEVTSVDALPKEGENYLSQDTDILGRKIVPLFEVTDAIKHDITYSQRDVLLKLSYQMFMDK